MIRLILIAIVVAVAAVLVLAALRPGVFRIERSASIEASLERIFPFINDFHRWTAWSPWEKMDPALKRTYSGPNEGKGARYAWEGNNKVGMGSMEITESSPPGRIVIKLDFIKPFEGHNIAEFTLVPGAGSTTVSWAMHGPVPYIGKVMHLFFSMDKLVGRQFEEGLANLKAAAESAR